MALTAKICGLKDEAAIKAAVDGGAGFLGFNFYAPSPRYISPESAAKLAALVPAHVKKVALFVDPEDGEIDAALKYFNADILQLHGAESPQEVADIKARYGKPVIKAMRVFEDADLEEVTVYEDAADWFLFDSHPAPESAVVGGTGMSFNWLLMKRARVMRPWFLAGGLNAGNLAEAAEQSGARMVDVASGVEKSRGTKDPGLITEFLKVAASI